MPIARLSPEHQSSCLFERKALPWRVWTRCSPCASLEFGKLNTRGLRRLDRPAAGSLLLKASVDEHSPRAAPATLRGPEFHPPEFVAAHYAVEIDAGLSTKRARELLDAYGPNALPEPRPQTLLERALSQFQDRLVQILLAAAGISFVLAITANEPSTSAYAEPAIILVILLLNAGIGALLESRADDSIRAMQAYLSEKALVIRDQGSRTQISARELVPGDVIELRAGDLVPADARVVRLLSNLLQADESILTGESDAVEKFSEALTPIHAEREHRRIPYQEQRNMLFTGSVITRGRCLAIVVATGLQTAVGQIRQQLLDRKHTRPMEATEQSTPKTPLAEQMNRLGDVLTNLVLGICATVFALNLFQEWRQVPFAMISSQNGADRTHLLEQTIESFKFSVALAVAAVPEGLPAVITTCLALGTQRMSKRNVLIRALPCVETLGCTSVICTDKTGTLTQNRMRVVEMIAAPQAATEELSLVLALCSEATLDGVGDPTELALLQAGEQMLTTGSNRAFWESRCQVIQVNEFDRIRKRMSVLVICDPFNVMMTKGSHTQVSRKLLLVKGAPESVLAECQFSSGDGAEEWLERTRAYSSRGLRCIALAIRDCTDISEEQIPESQLTFLGLAALQDPPRPGVRDAITRCQQAGIRVVMITGDHALTAAAIATEVGILPPDSATKTGTRRGASPGSKVVLGEDLENGRCAPEEIATAQVFARVEPKHKLRIVETLQRIRHDVVAMTGDGVNDAPALAAADVGVAMGTGTQVAKSAADMVIVDDNFATIVAAVEEGRSIYANMRQFIRYLLSSNIGEVIAVLASSLWLQVPEILTPAQLLWVNLITDGLPATALSFNPTDATAMRRPPRHRDEPFLQTKRGLGGDLVRYLSIGTYVGMACVLGYHGFMEDTIRARSVAMSVLVTAEMANALNAVSETESILLRPSMILENPWLVAAVAASMALQLVVLENPLMQTAFGVQPLSLADWAFVGGVSIPVIIVDEFFKFFLRRERPLDQSKAS
jgi:Ca2+ transporting ATPase